MGRVELGYSAGMHLLPHCRRGNWGYITRTGEVAISPRFGWAGTFNDGLARVSQSVFARDAHDIVKKSAFAYIDETGVVVSEGFDQACDVSQGLGCVNIDAVEGYAHYDGLAYLSGGLWGYADRTGVRLHAQFDYARSFSDGLAAVKRGNAWTYIDREGLHAFLRLIRAGRAVQRGTGCSHAARFGGLRLRRSSGHHGDPVVCHFRNPTSCCGTGVAVQRSAESIAAHDASGHR
jgi:hypothetical protein